MTTTNRAVATNRKTAAGETIYDLDPLAGDLWAVAGPAGVDPTTIDPDCLPEGFRWIDEGEWEAASEADCSE